MGCDTYAVMVDNVIVARAMSIDNALILVKALMLEWWQDVGVAITIQRESKEADK